MREKRTVPFSLFSLCIISLISLQGCAADKPLVKKELSTVESLKAVRYATPEIKVASLWRSMIGATVGVVLMGPAGVAAGANIWQGKLDEGQQIPDFGYLVMVKFAESANREIPNWPRTIVQDQPVDENLPERCALLEVKVKRLTLTYLGAFQGNGLVSETIAAMKDTNGTILWQKSFAYMSSDFKRGRSMEEFEAENGRLLKEEIEFAAERTVAEFIKHLKG